MLKNSPLLFKPTLQNCLAFLTIFLVFMVFDAPGGMTRYNLFYNLFCLSLVTLLILTSAIQVNIKLKDAFFIVLFFAIISIKVSLMNVFAMFNIYICITLAYFFFYYFKHYKELLTRGINWLIRWNVTLLVIQVVYYYLTSDILDFHGTLFPWTESRYSQYQMTSSDLFRATGMHNEPGTYATVISFLILSSLSLQKKVTKLHLIALATMLLTSSGTAVVFASALALTMLSMELSLTKPGGWKPALMVIVAIFFVALFTQTTIFEYLYWRFASGEVESGTVQLKYASFNFLLEADWYRLLFGSGLQINDCPYCKSIQDTGLLFNIFFQLGLVAGTLFLVCSIAYFTPKTITQFVLFIILMLCKLQIIISMIWIGFYMIKLSQIEGRLRTVRNA